MLLVCNGCAFVHANQRQLQQLDMRHSISSNETVVQI
jgi:hypothetical protein